VGERFKERPSDCVIDSHALMIKGGYMKYVANGIYSQYPILKRVTKKIEDIIREEMDAIDGQEVLFPVALPADLWEESGRYESVGSELLRFTDRNNSKLVLGMTHEEAAVQLVRDYAKSYTKYPFMIYQIQTKFRDEARPRAGMIRVREFTMKDAYSFHTSMEDLEQYYKICFDAYHKIFARAGVKEVIDVASDSGMMGGSISHEYMLLTPVGEDSIAICKSCDYRSNLEAAENFVINKESVSENLTLVKTPHCKTIEEVCSFLKRDVTASCKAVVYQKNRNDEYVVVFTRGDVEVNETKLRNYLKEEIHPAVITDTCGLQAGFIGPYQITQNCTVLYDTSLDGIQSLVCGANQEDYHYTGLNITRDLGEVTYVDLGKILEGGICPHCKQPSITISRGIEVGNIFQLGTKYSKAMNMQYTDEHGELQYPIMGCYGIGVGRLAASVCEAHHDEYGPIWPITIAPYEVHLCAIRSDDKEVRATSDQFYQDLLKDRIEVIFDDRNVRPGVMFADADLLGVPVRVIISPKNLKEGVVEITTRDKAIQVTVPLAQAMAKVKEIIADLYNKYTV
jgi:prolyl-tRNA synthetase